MLNVFAEPLPVQRVDAPIHDPKGVGGADQRITVHVEDRVVVNGDDFQVATELLPGIRHSLICVYARRCAPDRAYTSFPPRPSNSSPKATSPRCGIAHGLTLNRCSTQ